jgi:hypothetical protein
VLIPSAFDRAYRKNTPRAAFLSYIILNLQNNRKYLMAKIPILMSPLISWRLYEYSFTLINIIIKISSVTFQYITLSKCACPSSPLEHWGRGFESHSRRGCLCAFILCLYTVLCVGIGLASGWHPVRGVLLTVYRIKKLKNDQGPKGCRAIEEKNCTCALHLGHAE